MVELQACAGLINASALCEIDQESKGGSVNVILKISDELQRERKRNAVLMEKISFLEAKLVEERLKETQLADGKGDCSKSTKRSFKRFKKSKEETENNPKIEKNQRMIKHDTQCFPPKGENLDDRLVNWMSMDETQFMHYEKSKECDIIVDCVDTDVTHDEDYDYQEENDIRFEMKDCEVNGSSRNFNDDKQHMYHDPDMRYLENHSAGKPTYLDENTEAKECARSYSLPEMTERGSKSEINKAESIEVSNGILNIVSSENGVCGVGSQNISLQRKPPKLAFCPKEAKAIIKSEVLLQKNAQSHTMRKIIVFACLGIRHGCEEIYELDFNHFSILRKGEPYISPQTPGEHVLYENPGVRRKIFYPDRHNPTLCPVQILEEEKAMRPLDANCPSCLFLCIKYGGRTRNLPQNEYVRQRMGSNKLKSFGPLMCRLAMLVNIRSGSFFFKALGITLLFMSGCPDDLVRKETKYRNLDLLQKYYRTDKDAEGEELFLAHPTIDIEDKSVEEQLAGKKNSKKAKRKKQSSTNKLPSASHKSVVQVQESSSSKQSGLVGYTSVQTHATASFQSLPSLSQIPVDHNHSIPNPMFASSCAVASSQNQNPFNYFPPNPFVPMIYWPPPTSFSPGLYPPAYNYHSFPSAGNYMSFQSQPYCSYPYSPFISKPLEKSAKTENVSEETNSDSESSSSSKDQNTSTSCKQ